MILKGSQRAGGADLALHLMNAQDNERIEIGQIRGTVAGDLSGAFGEYEAIAAGTRCQKPLYSLSINPPTPLTRQQYRAAIDRIERGLGLSGQPRAVVFHVKNGREHCHVVWSRVDSRTLKAVHISHDRMKLKGLARDLAREFGLKLPDGLKEDGQGQRGPRQDITLAEKLQAANTGISPEQRRHEITQAYRGSDSAEAFRSALAQKGYVLARGDRRGFVLVDRHGEVHSLARQIEGVRTGAIKKKLSPLTPDQLPTVDQARVIVRERRKAADEAIRKRVSDRTAEALKPLRAKQALRRLALEQRRQQALTQHAAERLALAAAQRAEQDKPFTRAAIRLFSLIERMPALRSVLAPIIRNPALNPLERHAQTRDALRRRHQREKDQFDRREEFLSRLEAREQRSLRTALTRKLRIEERARAERYDQLLANTQDITAPKLGADAPGKAMTGKDGWKQRQEQLSKGKGVRQTRRPPGYRIKRDEPQ